MSASSTWTPAPMATLPHAKSLKTTPNRRKTSMRPPASNNVGMSPHLFTPSMDARTAEQRLAWLLSKKLSRTFSDMANFILTRTSLAVI
ncbi:hypothetical protein ACHAW6_004475 [Cyclotella cf. meneghiniana]